MKRVHALVEGQTEEAFLESVLAPRFLGVGVHLTPVLVETRRLASGVKSGGGTASYARWRAQIRRLLGDSSAALVTTMLDYYALPGDFPGHPSEAPTARERVDAVQSACAADIGDPRFVPFVTLHEFEALVLTAPQHVCDLALASSRARAELSRLRASVESPEDIDDGPDTHPSARITRLVQGYRKTTHGPLAAERIGLAAIRAACPHFDRWVARLESLGEPGEARI